MPFLDIFHRGIWPWPPSCHESWYSDLGWYYLWTSEPQYCSYGHISSCFPARVCMLGKTGLHLHWDRTSLAIQYVPIQYCQLGECGHSVFPFGDRHTAWVSLYPFVDLSSIKVTITIDGNMAGSTKSPSMAHNIPSSVGILTFSVNQTFFFIISF